MKIFEPTPLLDTIPVVSLVTLLRVVLPFCLFRLVLYTRPRGTGSVTYSTL